MSTRTRTPLSLNARQRDAIEHDEGPLLVVAGAGTGKTRVITERIRRLLEANPRLSGENILGLTFTEKAAAEMKHRVIDSVGERGHDVWLGTFHGFCLNVVLKPIEPELEVAEGFDHWILLRRNIRELQLERYLKLHEPGQFLSDFLRFFSRCQDELVTPDDYDRYVEALARKLEADRPQLSSEELAGREILLAEQREVARAYRVSDRLLRDRREVTFGSMILEAEHRLRRDPALAARLSERFRYILVDEFQDTNVAQIALLHRLAGPHRNLFVVGDDDQAIYRFRGASFASFKRFAEDFLAPAGRANRHLALTENYRSTRRILRVAGEVITQNRDRYLPDKRLETPNAEGDRIRVAEFPVAELEAHWIAGEIERLHAAGQRWGSMAVLYRKHTHRDLLVRSLALRGVPFVIRGLSILQSTLVRDLIACLRLIHSPSDNVSFARVFAAPYWRFLPEDLVRLAQRAAHNHRSLFVELRAAPDFPRDTDAESEAVRVTALEFVRWITGLGFLAFNVPATDLLTTLVDSLNLNLVPSSADELYLKRFLKFAAEWQKKNAEGSLAEFMEYLEFFFEAGEKINLEEHPADDAVQLMTAHGAKGLEFENVFIIRLSQRAFPSGKRRPLLEFPAELMKEAKPEGDFHVQEERRLFYVALTRARRLLTLTAVVNARTKASPFLEDFLSHPQIQARDVERLSPKVDLPPEELAVGTLPADPSSPGLIDPARQKARAWSRIALWAGSCRPPVPVPLVLSATAIDTYSNCPQQYLFEKGWGLRGGPRAPLTFGNLMHSTIQHFVAGLQKGHLMALEDLLAIYHREWDPEDYQDSFQEELYRKAGEEQLRSFHACYTELAPDVLYQEKTFELPLSPDLVITGRIDQMNRLGKGRVQVVDYKTGSSKSQKDADKNLQLSLYALAAREVFEVEPERLVLWYLKTDERVETTRDAPALNDARQKAIEIAAQIRAGQFEPRPGFLCRFCEYDQICPAHEQLVLIQPASAPVEEQESVARIPDE
jgi:DNA helicase-2/ATP-dependent DNA helicase PcrA